jgi:fumarate reductase flavoprotein subunit
VDRDARVLDTNGAAIPGLFAAGEAAGGILGERHVGSGINLAIAFTFGRISGDRAARRARVLAAAV